jgi:hypothetical protein
MTHPYDTLDHTLYQLDRALRDTRDRLSTTQSTDAARQQLEMLRHDIDNMLTLVEELGSCDDCATIYLTAGDDHDTKNGVCFACSTDEETS